VPGCVAPAPAADDALDPASAWACYALRAPVSFVQERDDDARAVCEPVPFEQWVRGTVRLGGRAPTAADLDVHMTTLFPPVRLRACRELPSGDRTPPRGGPALAAVATTLMAAPVAAALATEPPERPARRWTGAARDGLGDPMLAASARRCVAIAATRAPAG